MPSAPRPGEPITSAFLADLDRRAGGPKGGQGSQVQIGPGGQVMVPGKPWFAFVECTQDFTAHDKSDPGTGKVKLLDYDLAVTGDEFDCDSLINDPKEGDQFWITFNERTGKFEVLGAGGDCGCDEVHELKTENNPTSGSVGLTYTVNGVTGSSATINYNSTAAAAKTAIVASNSEFTSSNVEVYDGPWPFVAIYIRFVGNLAGQVIALPAVSNSLSGTNAVPKLGRLTSPGWP